MAGASELLNFIFIQVPWFGFHLFVCTRVRSGLREIDPWAVVQARRSGID
jgi:hypothetical protein